jgi:hypothetical protein
MPPYPPLSNSDGMPAYPPVPSSDAGSSYPPMPTATEGPVYPGLAEYMGLEFSESVIRENMPEYLLPAVRNPVRSSLHNKGLFTLDGDCDCDCDCDSVRNRDCDSNREINKDHDSNS